MTTILELPDGIHADVPHEVYHQRVPGLASKGALDLLDRSPSHYKDWLDAGESRPASPPMLFGSALHCALLEPELYASTYTVEPDFGDCRFKDAKAARNAWRLENEGRTRISPDDAVAIQGMRQAVRAHPVASKLLTGGQSELTVRWTDPDTGIICKARSDYYVERLAMVVDVKTTEDARRHSFRQTVRRFRYHVQQAFYSDGFAVVGAPLRHFVFLAIEKTRPYAIATYNLDADAVTRGHRDARANLETLASCVELGQFPSYETSIQTLDLPSW